MNLAASTLGCPTWTFPEIVERTASYGLQGIELRGVGEVMAAGGLPQFSEAELPRTKELLCAHGMRICTLATSVRFHDPAFRQAAEKEAAASIALCRRAGIPALRVFGDQLPEEGSMALVVDGIARLCAQAPDLEILLEVHGAFRTVEALRPVLKGVDAPNFGIIWDVAHSDEAYGDAWRPFYDLIFPWIREIHLKDHRRGEGSRGLCLMGEGDIPWRAILSRLRLDGFDGWYTLEWEKRWQPWLPGPEVAFPQFVRWMKEEEDV